MEEKQPNKERGKEGEKRERAMKERGMGGRKKERTKHGLTLCM